MKTIAALYVDTRGIYVNLEGVEAWDEARDARTYAGPHPVVAHPPCARWCRLAGLVASRGGLAKRDDGGTFASALDAVRRYGGVLEHPAYSDAWRFYGLLTPPTPGGWVTADWEGGWTCCVAQRNYGHRATKRTWLYANGSGLPPLIWGDGPESESRVSEANGKTRRGTKRMSPRERLATPLAFRNLLLAIARSAHA